MDRDLSTRSAAGLLTLLGVPGIGRVRALRLARELATLGEIREALAGPGLPHVCADAWERAHARALAALERANRERFAVATLFDAAFPEPLRAIPRPPPVLFTRGDASGWPWSVACVGTREPSRFGVVVTHRITHWFVSRGWAIVSGLARGVDTIAHRAALAAGGRTIAVLACGLDRVYPFENARLAASIVEQDGALVSEQVPGEPATPANLVWRDRLITGLSSATIVTQTDLEGGAIHAVASCLAQGRLLVAPVPPEAHAAHPKSRGLLALTAPAGRGAASLAGAGALGRLLLTLPADRPAALPIRDRSDYAMLESALGLARSPRGSPLSPGSTGRSRRAIRRGACTPEE